jgi:hypothetical protein
LLHQFRAKRSSVAITKRARITRREPDQHHGERRRRYLPHRPRRLDQGEDHDLARAKPISPRIIQEEKLTPASAAIALCGPHAVSARFPNRLPYPPIFLHGTQLPNDLEREWQQSKFEHLLWLATLPVSRVAQVMQCNPSPFNTIGSAKNGQAIMGLSSKSWRARSRRRW